jgi:hypothetical protein
MRRAVASGASTLLSLAVACGGDAASAKFPAREKGCDVRIFERAPPMATKNLGAVRARCAPDVPDDDCIRTLKDEACAMGADAIWGVGEPSMKDGRKVFGGRAVHTQ